MITVDVEGVYKKFSRSLGGSVLSGVREIVGLNIKKTSEDIIGDEFWALQNVSFRLVRGDSLAILGSNGSGKTTLLRLLNGTYKPSRGRIAIKEPTGSLIAAGAGFSPTLTGKENIFLSASLLGISTQKIRSLYESIVDFSELGDFLDMPLSHYSSGMSVRLAFAVATCVVPEVLLVDEVLAVGDIGFQRKCFERIQRLREGGTTLLIVSHSVDTVWELCNKALYLEDGKTDGIENVKNVVSKYINGSVNRSSKVSNNLSKILKEGPVTISEFAVSGSGTRRNGVNFRDDIEIDLNFTLEVDIRDAFFRVNLSNELYMPIATADSSLSPGGIKSLEHGSHKVKMTLEQVNLKPGNYSLDFSISSKQGGPHIGLFQNIIEFKVLASAENPLYDYGLKSLIDLPLRIEKADGH